MYVSPQYWYVLESKTWYFLEDTRQSIQYSPHALANSSTAMRGLSPLPRRAGQVE